MTTGHADIDLSGRDRLARSVLTSWGGYLVFIVAGFVMPRAIDRHVGQVALGIWDFCWSIVHYFNLTQIGVGSSVNRFVALHRATQDIEGLRRAVASVMCVQVVAAFLTVILSIAAGMTLPLFFAERLGGNIDYAGTVVILLGGSLAVQMVFNAYGGVITGCHRWDLHNWMNAGFYSVTVIGMITALAFGGGLRSLALVNLCGVTATEITRAVVAHRVCPELRVRPSYARWSQSKQMITFGGKTLIEGMSHLLLIQANSILVAIYLGPAALAVYSRPVALVRHAQTFMNKFAFVLSPTAGSLYGTGRTKDLRALFVKTSRYGVSFALPLVLFLSILGGQILKLWMGPRYESGIVITILAAGYFLPLTQRPVVTILTGMNLHGRVGVINIGLAICGIGLGILGLGTFGWGLVGAALAISLPLTIGNGIILSIYGCRCLGIKFGEYIRKSFQGPVVCGIPYAVCLVIIRYSLQDHPVIAIASGMGAGVIILGPLYWRFVITSGIRDKIRNSLSEMLIAIKAQAEKSRASE